MTDPEVLPGGPEPESPAGTPPAPDAVAGNGDRTSVAETAEGLAKKKIVLSDKRKRGEVKVTLAQKLMYHFVRAICSGASKLIWRVSLEGKDNVPKTGAFILSANHRSNVDTPLAATVTTRKLRFLGKDSMWKYGFTDWFFTNMGGFPVHRGVPDRDALRRCENLLRAGQPLVMFPEGTRRSGPLVEDFFEGPAYLAMKCQVPIVPVGIGGSERAMPRGAKFIRFSKVAIVIGEPIPPPPVTDAGRVSRKAVHNLTETLRERIQELFDRAQIRAGG